MSSPLRRIEEKYNGNEHVLSPRSDVVKLARALECVLDSEGGCNCEGPNGNCPWCVGWRTLEEVAGDEPEVSVERTVRIIEEERQRYPCECGEGYKTRDLTDPHCARCNDIDYVCDEIKRRLKTDD